MDFWYFQTGADDATAFQTQNIYERKHVFFFFSSQQPYIVTCDVRLLWGPPAAVTGAGPNERRFQVQTGHVRRRKEQRREEEKKLKPESRRQ